MNRSLVLEDDVHGVPDDDELTREQALRDGITLSQASKWTTVANIVNNVIGSGLLVLPWALSQSSAIPGLLMLTVIGSFSTASLQMLASACERTKVFTIEALWTRAWGRERGDWTARVVNFVFLCFAYPLSYPVLVGNFMSPVLRNWFGQDHFLSQRNVIVIGSTALLMVPLSLLPNLSSLRHVSSLGIVSVAFVAILVLATTIENGIADSFEWFRLDFGIFVAMGIMNMAYACHFNGPRLYGEMRHRTPSKFGGVALLSIGSCLLVYGTSALSGYMQFGEDVCGDVLSSLPGDGWLFALARVLMSIVAICTYPLPLAATRANLDAAIFGGKRTMTRARHVLLTLVVASVGLLISLAVPFVETLLGFQGAVAGSFIVYVFPALMFLRLVKDDNDAGSQDEGVQESLIQSVSEEQTEEDTKSSQQRQQLPNERNSHRWLRVLAFIMVVFGIVTSVFGTYVTASVSPRRCDNQS